MDTKVEEVDDPNPDRLRLAMASQKLQHCSKPHFSRGRAMLVRDPTASARLNSSAVAFDDSLAATSRSPSDSAPTGSDLSDFLNQETRKRRIGERA